MDWNGTGSYRLEEKMQTTRLFYRVDRRQINIIRFIFEAYEGLAVVTTLDAASGVIVLAVAPGCEKMAQSIMLDLGQKIMIEPMASWDRVDEA